MELLPSKLKVSNLRRTTSRAWIYKTEKAQSLIRSLINAMEHLYDEKAVEVLIDTVTDIYIL
jgi:hypothetical protein